MTRMTAMTLMLASSMIYLPVSSARADNAAIETSAQMFLYVGLCRVTEAESANIKTIARVFVDNERKVSASFKEDMAITISKTEALEKMLVADNVKRARFCRVWRDVIAAGDKALMDAIQ